MKLTDHATLVSAQIAALRAWAGGATSVTRAAVFRDTRGDRWVAFALADQSLSLRLPYGPRGILNTGLEHARTIARFAGVPVPGAEHATRPPPAFPHPEPQGLSHAARAIETPWHTLTRQTFAQHAPAALAVDPDALCTTLEALPASHPGVHLAGVLLDGSDLLWTLQAVYALDVTHRGHLPLTLAPTEHGLTVRGEHPEHGALWIATLPHYPARSAVIFDADAPAVVVCHECGRLAAHARTEAEVMELSRFMRWVELDAQDGPRWYCPTDAPALAPTPANRRVAVGTCAPDDETDRDPYELTRQRVRRRGSGLTPAVPR